METRQEPTKTRRNLAEPGGTWRNPAETWRKPGGIRRKKSKLKGGVVGSIIFGMVYTPNHPPLQLTFFPPGSARFPPGSAGFRWVLPLRRVPLGSAGFQALPVQFRRVLPGFRQQASCSRLTLQSIARIVQGSCQAFAKVAAIKVKEAVFANARTLCKSAHGKKHQ